MLQDPILDQFVRQTFAETFQFINGYLINYQEFNQQLNNRIKIKAGENEQFEFDVALDEIYLSSLHGLSKRVRVFSEESAWSGPETADYTVIYDPLCNSSLAARTFLDAAVGMTFFDSQKQWLASLIMDYQTGILGVAQANGTCFWQIQSESTVSFERMAATDLSQAWVVLTLEAVDERLRRHEADEVLDTAKRVISSSGHIYWLRLAEGTIDAYADPFGGEELYEMFACMVAIQAGCMVTDMTGQPFNPDEMLGNFEHDRHYRFYPVAARTASLHQQLLAGLRSAGSKSVD
ncbi:hypothetical protein IPG36_02020 [bacterium]|nr:MAG: hypothetical protein IPG36_02020 [bacterium]